MNKTQQVKTSVNTNIDPYAIAGNFTIKMAVTADAGTLEIKKPDYQARKISVTPGQKNVRSFQLELVPEIAR